MNPSASGWIDKFGYIVKDKNDYFGSFEDLYALLKGTGFVYGINLDIPPFIIKEVPLSEDEKAKINLITVLYFTYTLKNKEPDFKAFLESIFMFYKDLGINRIAFLNKFLTAKKTSSKLENLLNSRIYLEDNVISKTFNNIITNSLLFVDVLSYKRFLEGETSIKEYAQRLEHITINITYHPLNSPSKRSQPGRSILR